jgi:hypothetical protein
MGETLQTTSTTTYKFKPKSLAHSHRRNKVLPTRSPASIKLTSCTSQEQVPSPLAQRPRQSLNFSLRNRMHHITRPLATIRRCSQPLLILFSHELIVRRLHHDRDVRTWRRQLSVYSRAGVMNDLSSSSRFNIIQHEALTHSPSCHRQMPHNFSPCYPQRPTSPSRPPSTHSPSHQ